MSNDIVVASEGLLKKLDRMVDEQWKVYQNLVKNRINA